MLLMSPGFLSWKLRVVLATSLTWLAVLASETQAGCGDYVVVGAEAEQAALAMQHAREEGSSGRPCHGPRCQRGTEFPPTPVAPWPNTRLTEQASILSTMAADACQLREAATLPLALSPPDGFPLFLDRPPQV